MIQLDSIRIEIDVDQPGVVNVLSDVDRFAPMYPVANTKPGEVPLMGYGQTLSRELVNPDANVVNATHGIGEDEKRDKDEIQKQSVRQGEIAELGPMTVGEYELIWNDFIGDPKTKDSQKLKNVVTAIKEAMVKGSRATRDDGAKVTVDSESVFVDERQGSSFNGARKFIREQSGTTPDEPVEFWKDIKNLTLKFRLKPGLQLEGNLTKISITFESADGRLIIPKLDASRSAIDRQRIFAPVPDSKDNDVFTIKSLNLSTRATTVEEISIGLKIQEADWKDITRYIGAYWEIATKRQLQGSVSLDGEPKSDTSVSFDGSASIYVYHDPLRDDDGSITEPVNTDRGEEVLTKTINKGQEAQNVN